MTAMRRLTEEDVCLLEVKCLRTDRGMDRHQQTGSPTDTQEEDATPVSGGQMMGEKAVTVETSDDELGRLDIDLDRKSKQLNLTSSNVRAILHEVITDERVVAMMKAAIRDTQDLPMFEPKIWTRSRLKQSLQPVNRGLSAVKKAPQFIDIELQDNEDSSDEEYCPDEEEEEEEDTTEETFLSDADSLASPPRMHLGSQNKSPTHLRMDSSLQRYEGSPHDQMSSTCAPQLLPPPESSFLERLKAVDEELDCSPSYTYGQSLDRKSDVDGGVDNGSSSLAYRTRSKRPLVDVPLGQLEAELLPPDITADMYDESSAQREEDRHWTKWLQGLMAPDFEEEAEDDDDPEYNFPEDLDEPDLEDYRTDRAVQITKKEVNELLEELFETLQEEEEVVAEEEEHEEEEPPSQTGPKFNVPQALRFEAPLANMLTERRQTVRKQYEAQQQRRALQDTTNHLTSTLKDTPTPPHNAIASVLVLPRRISPSLHLDHTQKLQLQQQLQQHVQLLTQVHLLSRHIAALNHEASITKRYLEELQHFARHQEQGCAFSCFRACNLQGALDLLHEVEQRDEPPPAPPTRASKRWLPQMTPATNSLAFPLLPADTAWLFATRPVFLYPELLPVCSLDPALHSKNLRTLYTPGEDGLIALGLKHFEGAFQSDELISSHLLCKSRWNFRKHVREMSGPRAPDNVIKTFVTKGVVPPLPLACSRVQPEDQRPPVDRDGENMPNWLKNSRPSIQKTQSDACYPPWLPPGCTLRLHPNYINRYRPRPRPHRRVFTLAHNEFLLPLAKAQEDLPVEPDGEKQVDMHFLPVSGVTLLSAPTTVSGALPLAPASICGAVPLTAVHPGPAHPVCAKVMQSCFPFGQNTPQTVSAQESPTPSALLLPIPSLTSPNTTNTLKPGCLLLQMVWTPSAPPTSPQNVLEHHIHGPISEQQEEAFSKQEKLKQEGEESMVLVSTLSLMSCTGDVEEEERRDEQRLEQEEKETVAGVTLNGGENNGQEQEQWRGGAGGEGGEGGGAGESEQGGEEEEGRQREERSGARDDGGEKDKDEDQDRHGDDDEEEDFDDLTQDEDEEEVMSSASEESVLSVPELQETMKQLTWLAAERRLCTDGDSEEEHSPTSPGSQEEEEEEEEGPKGEDSGEGRSNKAGLDEETPSRERTPGGVGERCPGRGRGRSRPHRGLRRSRQERHSKDGAKLLLLYDENILDNDPHRESKDMAFAQSYLSRVREALRDVPEQVEEFVSLLSEFEQVGDGQEVMQLFRKLRCILGNRTDLLQDFAAFLHPEQALLCGLFDEQQAFERSRRFLRQLEISFGDNPSHYQKIIKALQIGQDLSPTSVHELKAQMSMLLKGHTHLQAEFWVFFDELRPPPAHPGQFEETHWPEDGGGGLEGGEGVSQDSGGGASGGFEEVTLPELEEEEEGHKIQPMTNRRQRRKMDSHRNYKGCDWSDKDWPCLCRDSKIQKHKRKGCSRCHGNKTSGGVSRAMKSLDPLYSQISAAHDEPGNKDLDLKGGDDSPQPDRCDASWEGSFPLADTKEEEEEEEVEGEEEEEERKREQSPAAKRSRREETLQPLTVTLLCSSACTSTMSTSSSVAPPSTTASSTSAAFCTPPRPAPLPPDLPVCAKNISLTASGEKVILWTREADRVILKTCQQEGANQNTFQAISSLLGNKTPSEVSRRFRDLMHLFRTAARQTSSEDEAPPIETEAANETEN
ncbi:GON-4-like protein isoform X2 [Oreochromis niloticus]|nr:GON-4-like protein isoform X2 [Oreochromis niloticus]